MKEFADLLLQLILNQARNRKLNVLTEYFKATPDPERGYALAILTGKLSFSALKPAQLKAMILERIDPVLFALSYDYVGDLAETIAYLWPDAPGETPRSLEEIVNNLQASNPQENMEYLTGWLNGGTPHERWALLKLITGGLRVGVSERLAKMALTRLSQNVSIEEVEEVWHGLSPPYVALFSWVLGHGPEPVNSYAGLNFRPLMLSHAIEESDFVHIDPQEYAAEWKWDGIRVQLVGNGKESRLYSRSGEDISHTFPDIITNVCLNAVLDGELLVKHQGNIASFANLQQRLNRKNPSQKLQKAYPAFIRLYDILLKEGENLRNVPFQNRRHLLEDWVKDNPSDLYDLSSLISFTHIEDLKILHQKMRYDPELSETEGFMLKRQDSPYLAGRVKGHWYKWKRDPLSVDLVMMYAQRGHGKRSSYYSDYTLGAWMANSEGQKTLIPVAKAYSGFTDAELIKLDSWVRNHTTRKFGPIREVSAGLVLEIEFDSIQPSKRHKSQLAMRFPRVRRIRWDKLADEADHLDELKKLMNMELLKN